MLKIEDYFQADPDFEHNVLIGTQTGTTTTHEASTRCSLEDHSILIESELNCVRKYTDPQTKYLHLERAKHELQRALLEVWHSFHISGRVG